ncbi:MAG TPA: 50S ribosomal protein L18 [Candidatus Acidoferrales bacterium]|nr:50S ribosomal protein L18 [Candidatus Acidoferrales bacterium]
MAEGPRYQVPFRRRRKGRTNYHKRLGLVLSRRPRMVVRKSGKNFTIQLVSPGDRGDLSLASANALELTKFGYNGSAGNVPAAYLTGLLFGKRSLALGYHEAVLDIGLNANSKGSRVYAALMGALETGLGVPYNEKVLPSKERVCGEHIARYANENPNNFSKYKISPKELPEHIGTVKQKIMQTPKKK